MSDEQTRADHASGAADAAIRRRLGALLSRLPAYLDNRWVVLSRDAAFFGDGSHGENGIRTNANVAFSLAVLLKHAPPALDPALRPALEDRLCAVVAYLAAAHRTGGGRCADGGRWGLDWQSSWWAAKLGMAARLAGSLIPVPTWRAVLEVVRAEADRHLTRLVPTGLAVDTKAEENAWDAEALACALALMPDHPRAPDWRAAFAAFSANTFSRPSDRTSTAMLDGLPVRDSVYTCNIHEDGTIENHGAYHFCYVASPLLSKTWAAHILAGAGQPAPEALWHNAGLVWSLARNTFLSNRFAYVSGQDWARYAYGEYFILPALSLLARRPENQQEGRMLDAKLRALEFEAGLSPDGSFYGARFTAGRHDGQFAKYETDCFCCVALALDIAAGPPPPGFRVEPASEPDSGAFLHVSPEAQVCFYRDADMFFSFSWRTLTRDAPTLCLIPMADDSLAEWHPGGGVGQVIARGGGEVIGVKAMRAQGDRLVIEGAHLQRDRHGRPLIEHLLRIEADLPARAVTVVSRHVARRRLWFVGATGLCLRFPNDIFNGSRRVLFHEGGSVTLEGHGPAPARSASSPRRAGAARRVYGRLRALLLGAKSLAEPLRALARATGMDGSTTSPPLGRWINIDDRIGMVAPAGAAVVVRRFRERKAPWESLGLVQVEAPKSRVALLAREGEALLDTTVTIHLGDHGRTQALARS